jgi:hypothetical protein
MLKTDSAQLCNLASNPRISLWVWPIPQLRMRLTIIYEEIETCPIPFDDEAADRISYVGVTHC